MQHWRLEYFHILCIHFKSLQRNSGKMGRGAGCRSKSDYFCKRTRSMNRSVCVHEYSKCDGESCLFSTSPRLPAGVTALISSRAEKNQAVGKLIWRPVCKN